MANPIGRTITKPIKYIFRRAGAEIVYDKLAAPYLARTSTKLAIGYFAALNAATGVLTFYTTRMEGRIFDYFAEKNLPPFVPGVATLALGCLAIAVIDAAKANKKRKIELSGSICAKEILLREYCSPRNRRRLGEKNDGLQPQQRLTDDPDILVRTSADLTLASLSSATNFISGSALLLSLSPLLLAGTWTLCAAGTALMVWREKGLSESGSELIHESNEYRTAIRNLASHRLAIALNQGELVVQAALNERLQNINRIGEDINRQYKWLNRIWHAFDKLSRVYPFLFIAHNYFQPGSRATIGAAFQEIAAFHNLRFAGNWYGMNQPEITQWKGAAQRLTGFLKSCESESDAVSRLVYRPEAKLAVGVRNLVLRASGGEILAHNISFDLESGDRLLAIGPSGWAAPLFQALAGTNDGQEGCVTYSGVSEKDAGKIMFATKSPYIPDMSLRRTLSFPKNGIVFPDNRMSDALQEARLGHITPFLKNDSITVPKLGLEGEELRRLDLARFILHKPSVIVLDDVTSKADDIELHNLLSSRLPRSIVIRAVHSRNAHLAEVRSLYTAEGCLSRGEFLIDRPRQYGTNRHAVLMLKQ